MTAFALKLSDATFTAARSGMRLRNRTKLVAEYLLGGSQAESVKNRANAALPLTVQGSPTYNATNVLVRSSATAGFGFLTGIIPNDDATIIVVRENAALATQPHIIGFGTAGAAAVGIRPVGTTEWFYCGEGAANKGANRPIPGAGAFFEAAVMSRQNPQLVTGGFGKLYYYSAGVQQVATSIDVNGGGYPRSSLLGGQAYSQICIGTTTLTDTITTNTIPIYFVAIYQRTLSPAEIDTVRSDLVAYYATRGVTVA